MRTNLHGELCVNASHSLSLGTTSSPLISSFMIRERSVPSRPVPQSLLMFVDSETQTRTFGTCYSCGIPEPRCSLPRDTAVMSSYSHREFYRLRCVVLLLCSAGACSFEYRIELLHSAAVEREAADATAVPAPNICTSNGGANSGAPSSSSSSSSAAPAGTRSSQSQTAASSSNNANAAGGSASASASGGGQASIARLFVSEFATVRCFSHLNGPLNLLLNARLAFCCTY